MTTTIRVDRPKEAAEAVATIIRRSQCRLVRIEGHSASGKTSLAKHLARVLGAIHVDTDAYLAGDVVFTDQMAQNVAHYLASGLIVLVEGIRLDERFPPSETAALMVLVSSDFEDPHDRKDADDLAGKLGTDRYFAASAPALRADVEVIVRVPSEHAGLIAAMRSLDPNADTDGL